MKVLTIAREDLRMTLRDKSSIFWIFFAPFLWVFFFGFIARAQQPADTRVGLTVVQEGDSSAARRFVEPETLAMLTRVMRPGAELLLATDDQVLQEWTKAQLAAAEGFLPVNGGVNAARPKNWIPTRYEAKALKAGRIPLYFHYRRNSADATRLIPAAR